MTGLGRDATVLLRPTNDPFSTKDLRMIRKKKKKKTEKLT